MDQKFSVPGREGWETNQADRAALQRDRRRHARRSCPVVALPAGQDRDVDPAVRARAAQPRGSAPQRALPGARVAGYGSTGDRAFVSTDGRTAFVDRLPAARPRRSPSAATRRRRRTLRAALRGVTVGGRARAPHRLRRAAAQSGGGDGGPGVLLEALLGGLGALIVLALRVRLARWRSSRC